MTIVLILLILLDVLCIAATAISLYIAWRSLTAFLASEAQKEEYQRFLRYVFDEIQDGSAVFRTELIKRFGANIPEMREVNSLLQRLEISMESCRTTLKQFLEEGD